MWTFIPNFHLFILPFFLFKAHPHLPFPVPRCPNHLDLWLQRMWWRKKRRNHHFSKISCRVLLYKLHIKWRKIPHPCSVATKSLSLRRKPEATISKRPPTPVKEKDNSLRELSFQNTNNDSTPVYSPTNDENWPLIISAESDEESKGSFLYAEDTILTTLRWVTLYVNYTKLFLFKVFDP